MAVGVKERILAGKDPDIAAAPGLAAKLGALHLSASETGPEIGIAGKRALSRRHSITACE